MVGSVTVWQRGVVSDRPLAVVDVDGVVADVRHRLHHLRRRPRDWDAFFAAATDDPPLGPGLHLVATLLADHDVVWLTGRPERLREVTQGWLADRGLPAGPLLMRRDGDRRPARIVKLSRLRRLARTRRVGVVVDDNPEVVAALRADGWPVVLADWVAYDAALRGAQEREGRT